MKPGDLIWLRDDMGNLTPAIYISEAPSYLSGPRIRVLHAGVVFDIGKHRARVIDEAGDLVRVTIMRSSGDDAPVIGIITKTLGGIVTDDPMWFNVMIEGKIEAVNEGEIEVLNDGAD